MRDNVDHACGWVRKAGSDLAAGRRLLKADGPFDMACFHAQQAAEKYLKAVMAILPPRNERRQLK